MLRQFMTKQTTPFIGELHYIVFTYKQARTKYIIHNYQKTLTYS